MRKTTSSKKKLSLVNTVRSKNVRPEMKVETESINYMTIKIKGQDYFGVVAEQVDATDFKKLIFKLI